MNKESGYKGEVDRRCTAMCDARGNLIFENDRCRSWHADNFHPEGGFTLYEIVRFFNEDWYLFEEGHNYLAVDDRPVLLVKYLNEIEVTAPG